MLETSKGISPVCIGPGVLHKRKLQSSYYTLPSSIVKYLPETKGVLVIGTDGEEDLRNALYSVFTDAIHLRCDMHLKDNVKRELLELNINSNAGREITRDIFGLESESCREGGLVDCRSEKEYSEALEVIKKRWPPLHENAKIVPRIFLGGSGEDN